MLFLVWDLMNPPQMGLNSVMTETRGTKEQKIISLLPPTRGLDSLFGGKGGVLQPSFSLACLRGVYLLLMLLMNLLNWPGEVERRHRGPLELSQGGSHYHLNGLWETDLRMVLVGRNPILSGRGGQVAWVVVSHR